MRDSYRSYVQKNTQHFRTLFAHLLEDRAPLVIHCTAGKDRTGFASRADPAYARRLRGSHLGRLSPDQPLLPQGSQFTAATCPTSIKQVLGSVQASFLAAAFEAIDADYGDLESYLRDGLGLGKAERAHLEARYLQR